MLIYSEKKISQELLPKGVIIKYFKGDEIKTASENSEIEIIICCRETARKVATIDLPSLKLLNLTSTGFDNVPIDVFNKKKIYVTNAENVYSVPISETVVYGMLQIVKKYHKNPNNRFLRLARNYKYITELKGKKVIILGAGNIGTAIAERLMGFDMNVIGYDKFADAKEPYLRVVNSISLLKQELIDTHFVISTLPGNDSTKGFINSELLDCMCSECIFVNVGRKSIYTEIDLYKSLKSRKIAGAVLDVFELIPNPITNRFRRLPNVIILPGVAAISKESKARLQKCLIENISLVFGNKAPKFIIGLDKMKNKEIS